MKKIAILAVIALFLGPIVAAQGPTASVNVEKETGLPFMKVVGPSTTKVEYEFSVKNTADFKAKFIPEVELCLEGTGGGMILTYHNRKTVGSGECKRIIGNVLTLNPGESSREAVVVEMSGIKVGQKGSLTFKASDVNGNKLSSVTKEINVQKPSATVSVSVVGVTLAIGGFSLAGLGVFRVI